jgi:hypothetical protein
MITNLDIQLFSWFIAVIALALSVFVLLLYIPQRPNRWFSLILLFQAINAYAIGMMAGASTVNEAIPGLLLSACMLGAVYPGFLLAGLTLLKPTWLHGRWKPIRVFLQGLTFVPMLIVAFDVIFGTHLIHRAITPTNYSGGIVSMLHIFNGPVGIILYITNIVMISTAACIIYIYLASFDKTLSPLTHRLAWDLSVVQIAILTLLILPGDLIRNGLFPLAGTLILCLVYTYATHQL